MDVPACLEDTLKVWTLSVLSLKPRTEISQRKMHIVQLGPYPPPEGGVARNLLAIRSGLRKSDHRCSVIAIAKSTGKNSEPGVFHPKNAFQLIALLRRLNFDVLHVHIGGEISLRVLALLFVCAILARGRNVMTLHSGGYALSHAERARPISLTGFVFRRYQKIIGVNPLMNKLFQNLGIGKDRFEIINPFSPEHLDEAIEIPTELRAFMGKHTPLLLAVCGLEDDYDLFSQISATEKLLLKFPKAGLLIVGSGSIESDIRQAIKLSPAANSFFLAGSVEHKITLHLINDCDILLRTTKFDGDAISIREALNLRTPVVATDNGMRPEGVHLIDSPADADSLAGKIAEVFASRTVQAGVDVADPDKGIRAVIDIYLELVNR